MKLTLEDIKAPDYDINYDAIDDEFHLEGIDEQDNIFTLIVSGFDVEEEFDSATYVPYGSTWVCSDEGGCFAKVDRRTNLNRLHVSVKEEGFELEATDEIKKYVLDLIARYSENYSDFEDSRFEHIRGQYEE